jgi:hypothetical protein
MNDITDFQAQAATVALVKMFKGSYFSICELDELAKLIGVTLGGPDYKALSILHCVNWADMPDPFRIQVRDKCVELLGLPPIIIDSTARKEPDIPQPTPQSRGGGLLRLLWSRK